MQWHGCKQEKAMKIALVLLLFAAPAFAQSSTPQASQQGPCGSDQIRFDVEKTQGNPSMQPEPGKALVYISEVFKKAPGEWGDPTLRIGLNGDWVGAVKGNSYFSFSVAPGENHLCLRWQSHFKRLSHEAAFTVLAAEAGKIYYFRALVTYDLGPNYGGNGSNVTGMSINLDPISTDEGQYLAAHNPMSVPHVKK